MLFSIITPSFNGLSKLKRAVGSVRGQAGVEREHVIQDAASEDGTVEWLKGQPDLSWKSEKDSGMYQAINRGWSRAKGGVLSWLNVDEQYLPGTLALAEKMLRENPDAEVIFGDTIIVGPAGDPLAARREIPLRAFYVKNSFLYSLSCSVFFRRSLWDRGLLRFDETYRNAGDAELMMRLLTHGVKVRHIGRYFSLFGVDGNNLTVRLAENMEKEGGRIREQYQAFRNPHFRRLVRLGRIAERLLSGCYREADLDYDFATDEKPNYRRVSAKKVTGRFTYDRAARILEQQAATT